MKKDDILFLIFTGSLLITYLLFSRTVVGQTWDRYEAKQHTPTQETVAEPIVITETVAEPETEKPKPTYNVPLPIDLQNDIYDLCCEYEFSYPLALAIIKTESNFKVDAVGDSGRAIGLCQIWPYWWSNLANERNLDLNVPKDNVEMMLIIITNNLNNYTISESLQIYNTGNPQGNEYADRVFANLELIESEVN